MRCSSAASSRAWPSRTWWPRAARTPASWPAASSRFRWCRARRTGRRCRSSSRNSASASTSRPTVTRQPGAPQGQARGQHARLRQRRQPAGLPHPGALDAPHRDRAGAPRRSDVRDCRPDEQPDEPTLQKIPGIGDIPILGAALQEPAAQKSPERAGRDDHAAHPAERLRRTSARRCRGSSSRTWRRCRSRRPARCRRRHSRRIAVRASARRCRRRPPKRSARRRSARRRKSASGWPTRPAPPPRPRRRRRSRSSAPPSRPPRRPPRSRRPRRSGRRRPPASRPRKTSRRPNRPQGSRRARQGGRASGEGQQDKKARRDRRGRRAAAARPRRAGRSPRARQRDGGRGRAGRGHDGSLIHCFRGTPPMARLSGTILSDDESFKAQLADDAAHVRRTGDRRRRSPWRQPRRGGRGRPRRSGRRRRARRAAARRRRHDRHLLRGVELESRRDPAVDARRRQRVLHLAAGQGRARRGHHAHRGPPCHVGAAAGDDDGVLRCQGRRRHHDDGRELRGRDLAAQQAADGDRGPQARAGRGVALPRRPQPLHAARRARQPAPPRRRLSARAGGEAQVGSGDAGRLRSLRSVRAPATARPSKKCSGCSGGSTSTSSSTPDRR